MWTQATKWLEIARTKHIAEGEGGADYEGGRRDHREGVREHPNSPVPVEIALSS